jgi:DNA-binding transcriptional regulator/RsmH inhibitor MraZ
MNNMYYAKELSIYLKHLILTDSPEGKIEWIGKSEDWEKVEQEIENYENK